MRSPIHIGLARLPFKSDKSGRNCPEPSLSIHSLPEVPPRYLFQRARSVVFLPITIRPEGPKLRSWARPNGYFSGCPPVVGIRNIHVMRKNGCAVLELNKIWPSGENPRTLDSAPRYVNRRNGPPVADITYTSACFSSRAVTASHCPSGETAIFPISPRPEVNLRGIPPVSGTVQTSSSATKNKLLE